MALQAVRECSFMACPRDTGASEALAESCFQGRACTVLVVNKSTAAPAVHPVPGKLANIQISQQQAQ